MYKILLNLANSIPEIKKTAVIDSDKIVFMPSLREICEKNQCGGYGMNWSCPPECGDINMLIRAARSYKHAFVYQTVWEISDCFDIEGMTIAQKKHFDITVKLRDILTPHMPDNFLTLSVVCGLCEKCTKPGGLPCRYPELRISSLEAYGILVSELADACDMSYINGENTVTYFGAFLFG